MLLDDGDPAIGDTRGCTEVFALDPLDGGRGV